jgi:hypothetical protein
MRLGRVAASHRISVVAPGGTGPSRVSAPPPRSRWTPRGRSGALVPWIERQLPPSAAALIPSSARSEPAREESGDGAVATETLTEAAQAAVTADHQERDREAGNLPRAPLEAVSPGVHRDGLDWDSFRDLYYPDSRRHNLEAIVAYGSYKRSPHADSPANEATMSRVMRARPKPRRSTSGKTRAAQLPSRPLETARRCPVRRNTAH